MSVSVSANGNSVHVLSVPKTENVGIMCSFNVGNNTSASSDISHIGMMLRASDDIPDKLYLSILFVSYYNLLKNKFESTDMHAKCAVTTISYSIGAGRAHVGIACSKKSSAVKKVLKTMVRGINCGPIVKEARRWVECEYGIKLKSDITKQFCEAMCAKMVNMDVMIAGKISAKLNTKESVEKLGAKVLEIGDGKAKRVTGGSIVKPSDMGIYTTPKCGQLELYMKWSVLKLQLRGAVDAETDKVTVDGDAEAVKAAFESKPAGSLAKQIAKMTERQQSGIIIMLAAQHAIGDALAMSKITPKQLNEKDVLKMITA